MRQHDERRTTAGHILEMSKRARDALVDGRIDKGMIALLPAIGRRIGQAVHHEPAGFEPTRLTFERLVDIVLLALLQDMGPENLAPAHEIVEPVLADAAAQALVKIAGEADLVVFLWLVTLAAHAMNHRHRNPVVFGHFDSSTKFAILKNCMND